MKTFEQYLQEMTPEQDNLGSAIHKLEKQFPKAHGAEDDMVKHLVGAGHSPDVASKAVKNHVSTQKILNSPAFAANASAHSHGD